MPQNKSEKTVSRADPLLSAPIYRRIEADLRARIQQGQWAMGMQLPSRKELARQYSVDLTTLQRAISALLEDGTLRAEVPRGTFVARATLPSAATGIHAGLENVDSAVRDQSHLSVLRPNTRLVATVGLIAYTDSQRPNWDNIIVDMLERTFADAGGAIRFTNMLQEPGDRSPGVVATEMLRAGVDALAFINIYDREGCNEQFLSALDVGRTPAMIVCWQDLEYPVPHVFCDNRYAGYQAADHLISSGYTPALFVAPFEALWADERLAGVRRALQAVGSDPGALKVIRGKAPVPYGVGLEAYAGRTVEVLSETMRVSRGAGAPPGIIAGNDDVAAMILRAVGESGKTAGVDFGLIGFNDDKLFQELSLSSLRPPVEDLGREAARNLIRMLQGETIPVQTRLQYQLIPRATTATQRR